MTPVALGIDLSTRGLGLCAVPADWDCNVRRVRACTFAYPLPRDATERQRAARLESLALDVRSWAVMVGATHVWLESYAYSKTTMAHTLGELGGVVKLELFRERRFDLAIANQSSARKLAYGRTPPRGLTDAQRKAWLFEPLLLTGLQLTDHNQGDAFVTANWGLSELGAPCFASLLVKPEAAE